LKNEANVKVCNSCDYLSAAFRRALNAGNYEDAIALFGTGNVNLRVPFSGYKGEQLYPIHCAVEGGDLDLFRWLVDEHFCPIRVIHTGSKKKKLGHDVPIITSKGRSVLSIAVEAGHVDILRYLVIEKRVSVHEIRNLKTALRALETVLNAFPSGPLPPTSSESRVQRRRSYIVASREERLSGGSSGGVAEYESDAGYDGGVTDEGSLSSFDAVPPAPTNANAEESKEEEEEMSTTRTIADACIICYANSIDCVITPCGHQICCLECSSNLSVCPVCNSSCQFIRVFRP